ncbi:MAG: hypothetical protein HFE47_05495 [Clostridia bacterium]|nr:hypothetical protein [Clostridia bacterium]
MRYINKEYGFAFRPPFNDKFYEEKPDGPPITSHNYPGRYVQGVGYDYAAINGAMLVGKYGSMWGIKVCCFEKNRWLDNNDFVRSMRAACANTADGSFAHFASGALSVKWVKHNEQSIILQVAAHKKLRVRVIFYPLYPAFSELSIEESYVQGRCPYVAVVPGNITIGDANAVFTDRYLAVSEDESEREYFMAQSFNKPSDSANGAFNEAIMEFVINKNQPSVTVYATVGDEKIFSTDVPRPDKILKQIETAELRYGVNRTMGTGVLGAPAERMLNSVLWSRIYYPYLFTEIYSPQRSVLTPHFDIRGLEENCCAILGCLTGIDKATNQLNYTVEDKVLAVLAVWHVFAHSAEKTDMYALYKKLTKLYPPEPKPIVCGSDKKEIAYKWHDSPLKEKYNTMQMYSLDLTCLKLLAFDILERIAALFSLSDEQKYARARRDLVQVIGDIFWNEEEGLYMERYVTGQWANGYGANSFYPLIAGAVDTPQKLGALVNNLTDPTRFWGNYIVPTLSVNNREYGQKGKPTNNGHRNPPYLQYRGSIVPYVNYIIYHGLCRYGLDEIAAMVAYKSARLWQNNESDNVENYSLYLPNGKRYKSKEYLSAYGNMLAMIGLQELIDLEYFRSDLKTESLRFGTFAAGNHSLTNLKMLGHAYSIEVNDLATTLIIDDVNVFRGEGGKFVVRNFLESGGGCRFMIDAHANITVHLCIAGTAKKDVTKYFFIVPVGKSQVVAEEGMVNIQPVTP